MREIKFRGWDIKKQKMFIPHSIDWNGPEVNKEKEGIVWIWRGKFDDEMHNAWVSKAFILNEEVFLMQSTGLKDKNGKEIYEGDIVTYGKDEPELVIYQGTRFKFSGNSLFSLGEYDPDKMQTVGNIYENPELLDRKESDDK